ncbi:uroporphyrinogen-III synthase [Dongia sp.]|uniref:uroporphyrinogen-III synthase n=1 Tax=Dongia sp. TaxID=1977262 RepID=UPI0035AF8680
MSLAARGIDVAIEPLLNIQPIAAPTIDLAGVQAVLFTSANGVRCFAAAETRRDIKILTVGDASATAARAAGFTDVTAAGGDVSSLASLIIQQLIPADGTLLHAAGSSLAGDLKGQLEAAGYTVRRVTLYDAVPADSLSAATLMNLRLGGIDAALFFSPRSARTFVDLWRRAEVAQAADGLGQVTALCLSAAVAREISGLGWRSIAVAPRPDSEAMSALVLEEQQRREAEMANPAKDQGTETVPDRASTADGIDEKVRAAAASEAAAGAAIVAAMPKPASGNRGSSLVLGFIAGAVAGAGMVVAEPLWRPHLPLGAMAPATADLGTINDEIAALKQQLSMRQTVDSEARQNIEALQAEITDWKDQLAQASGNATNQMTPVDLGPIEMRLAALEEKLKGLPAEESTTATDEAAAQTQSAEAPAGVDISALTSRIAELEGKFAALGDTTTRLDFLSSETAAQKAQIETTKAQLDNVSALGNRLDALEEQAKTLGANIDAVSQENAEAVLKRQRAAALVLSLGQLRGALASEAPFSAELAAVADLGQADADVGAKLDPALAKLRPFADTGVPTLPQLQAGFPAPRIAQAASADAAGAALGVESSWLQKTLNRLSELATLRPVGEVEGDTPMAHLARAEARLNDGDLAAAVNEAKALTGQAGDAAKTWLAGAEARLTLEAAAADLAKLSAEALAPAVDAGTAPSN